MSRSNHKTRPESSSSSICSILPGRQSISSLQAPRLQHRFGSLAIDQAYFIQHLITRHTSKHFKSSSYRPERQGWGDEGQSACLWHWVNGHGMASSWPHSSKLQLLKSHWPQTARGTSLGKKQQEVVTLWWATAPPLGCLHLLQAHRWHSSLSPELPHSWLCHWAPGKLVLFSCSLCHPVDSHHLHNQPGFEQLHSLPTSEHALQLCLQAWCKTAAGSFSQKCEPRQTRSPHPAS